MRRRKGPPVDIVAFRAAKAAAGGSGSGGGGGDCYRPGQNLICKITKAEPGGYAVIIAKETLPGYLPSNKRHNVGDEVLATFVCVDKNRILLSERFNGAHGELITPGTPSWERLIDEQLSDSQPSKEHEDIAMGRKFQPPLI